MDIVKDSVLQLMAGVLIFLLFFIVPLSVLLCSTAAY